MSREGTLLKKWKHLTLQQKLTAMFILTAVFILTVNLYTFSITNEMAEKVEQAYILIKRSVPLYIPSSFGLHGVSRQRKVGL